MEPSGEKRSWDGSATLSRAHTPVPLVSLLPTQSLFQERGACVRHMCTREKTQTNGLGKDCASVISGGVSAQMGLNTGVPVPSAVPFTEEVTAPGRMSSCYHRNPVLPRPP